MCTSEYTPKAFSISLVKNEENKRKIKKIRPHRFSPTETPPVTPVLTRELRLSAPRRPFAPTHVCTGPSTRCWARVFGSCPSPGEGRRHAGHPGICRCGPPRGTPLGHSCWGVRRRASPHRGSHTAVRAPGRAGVHPSQFPRCPRQRAKRQIQWGAMLPTDPALRATVGHPGGPRGDRMRQGECATDSRGHGRRAAMSYLTLRRDSYGLSPVCPAGGSVSRGPWAARQQQGRAPPAHSRQASSPPSRPRLRAPASGDPSLSHSLPWDLLATYRPC